MTSVSTVGADSWDVREGFEFIVNLVMRAVGEPAGATFIQGVESTETVNPQDDARVRRVVGHITIYDWDCSHVCLREIQISSF